MNSVKKLEGSKFEVTIVKSGAEVVSMREHVLTHFKDAKVLIADNKITKITMPISNSANAKPPLFLLRFIFKTSPYL